MNASEYVLVLLSIIIGLGLTDVLLSLHRLLRAGRKVRWDWAAPLSAALVLMTLVMMWWSFYEPVPSSPSIGEFLPDLIVVILLFLLAAAVLPDNVPAEGLVLRAYYDQNGPYFWSLYALTLGWLVGVDLAGAVGRRASLRSVLDSHLAELLILGLFVSLIFLRRRWWHGLVFAVLLATGPLHWISRTLG